MANFTLQDILGSAVAAPAFAMVLWAPGWVLAQVTDLFGFRGKSFSERMLWAVVCSFGVMPIAAYLVTKYSGLGLACWAVVLLTACAVGLVVRERTADRSRWAWSRREWILAAALCAWVVFVIGSLVDVQVGNKLYFNVAVFDQSYRVAFTDAVMRTGIPPANPLYFAGHGQPMRYYYFWYVECAMLARLAHVTARQAFIASSVWTGLGLGAMIALYTRYFLGVMRDARKQTWLAVALLAVTGADLLPALGNLFGQPTLNGDMEWWSVDQISSWVDSLLWVPHHIAGLLCCLLSFLLLWRTRELASRKQRWLAVGLAGVSFASGFGLSIYVAFGFALLMVAWMARLLVVGRQRELGLCGRIVAAGVASAIALVPFVRELTTARSSLQTGASAQASHVFVVSVRRMIDPELLTGLPVFATWNRAHPVLLDQTMRLLLLLPGLGFELGFYGAALVLLLLAWRRRKRLGNRLDEAHRTALYLIVCGLAMVLFVSSTVSNNNDFGFRAALLPQFFLLMLGASLLASWWFSNREAAVAATPRRRGIVYGLLALGVAGSLYQTVMLRAFLPIEASRPESGLGYLPAAAFQAREAFGKLNLMTPRAAVVEFNPTAPAVDGRGDVVSPFTFFTRVLLMDSGRQILDSEPECGTEFGGDTGACAAIMQATTQMYGTPTPPAAWAMAYCRRFGVDYLVVSRMDPAWRDDSGWAARLPVVVAEPDLRIVACGYLAVGR